ncbi:MAG TPA: lipoprotein [Oleiagrimonas sp.]|nr:lipoprotein [Oleiagrimonas sp.]
MRRIATIVLLGAIALALAGCGNKGPLVRPPASPDAAPAAAASSAPAPATSSSSTAPDYLSPPMPVSSASSTGNPS